MTGVNTVFREHVTGGAFNLDLRKSHIEALAFLDWRLSIDMTLGEEWRTGRYVRSPSSFSTGCNGLIRRGLVVHHDPYPPRTDTSNAHFTEFYTITEAGKLSIALLSEAGLWQEYAAAYPRAVCTKEAA